MDSAVLFDLGNTVVTDTFTHYMATLLDQEVGQISVHDLIVTPGSAVTTKASAFVPLRVEFVVQPGLNPVLQVSSVTI